MNRLQTAALAAGISAALAGAAQAAPPVHAAPPSSHAAVADQRLWFGAAWYPEQWPESRWDADLALMQAAGINVVRVGEFAWSRMEPAEGRYDLDWLERAIRLAQKHGIRVVIGTPTDAPPAWLTTAHPETLRVDADGRRAEHGGRRQFSISSPLYRDYCRKIATELARRFGHDPDVIGWQIGNEYTDESFDPTARRQFQDWLKAKYGSLDRLNAAWTTAYWSQTYDRWDEIPLNAAPGNPGWMLDHRHFVTDTWRSFQKVQLDAIRAEAAPRQFITTNIGGLGWSDNWDHYRITEDLDIAAWDPYVGQGRLDADRNGAVSDYVRGWKRRNYWVMETQPGFVNWAPVNNSLPRGEVRAMAWQDVAHGADAVLYWQWRSALNGQEEYHGALVGPDGEPLPIYDEIRQIGAEFARASAVLAGTTPKSEVAVLQTYDSRWAIDFQLHNKNYDQLAVMIDAWRPLEAWTHSVDIVEASAPLDGYKVVFAPDLNVIPDALAAHLADYVRQGGHLVLGPRAGLKDEFNRLRTERQPGALVGPLGARVEQFYALDAPAAVAGELGQGTTKWWAEALSVRSPEDKVLLRYGPGEQPFAGTPAVVTRKYGRGEITYLGGVLDAALMTRLADRELEAAHVARPLPDLPAGVEAGIRRGAGREVVVLINHNDQPAQVSLPPGWTDVLAGGAVKSPITLARQGVVVLSRPESSSQHGS